MAEPGSDWTVAGGKGAQSGVHRCLGHCVCGHERRRRDWGRASRSVRAFLAEGLPGGSAVCVCVPRGFVHELLPARFRLGMQRAWCTNRFTESPGLPHHLTRQQSAHYRPDACRIVRASMQPGMAGYMPSRRLNKVFARPPDRQSATSTQQFVIKMFG